MNEFNNSIDNTLLDYQGNLWFTSSRLGLLRLAQSAFKDIYTTIGMQSRVRVGEPFQRAEFLVEHGVVDQVVHRLQMKETIHRLLKKMTYFRQAH